MLWTLWYCCLVVFLCFGGLSFAAQEQIHLSFGKPIESQVTVQWVDSRDSLRDVLTEHVVQYGLSPGSLNMTLHANLRIYVNSYSARISNLCEATLMSLLPGTVYFYRVGDVQLQEFSDVMSFRTISPSQGPYSFLVFGDAGVTNFSALPFLVSDAQSAKYDMTLMLGDSCYDCFEDEGKKADEFLNMLQPLYGGLPVQMTPGNHEDGDLFRTYLARFRNQYYYSFDCGSLVHIVSVTSEAYFSPLSLVEPLLVETQLTFLDSDLRNARLRNPNVWLVVFFHRPLYCSNNDDDHNCFKDALKLRTSIEPVLEKHGVDLVFVAHEHSYERLYPVNNNGTVAVKDWAQPYRNPQAPVYLVVGNAGNKEGSDTFTSQPQRWSAFRTDVRGYGRLFVQDQHELRFEAVSAIDGSVIDEFTIQRDLA